MMTSPQQRHHLTELIEEAVKAGARRAQACACIGLSLRTLERWNPKGQHYLCFDQRACLPKPKPVHALTESERAQILELCNQPEYASLGPSKIVPMLADLGQYLASESSFYRILKAHNQLHHRGHARAPRPKRQALTHVAFGPNQVWTWDVTWLPSRVKGQFYYLYMINDLYSRYGVGWEVHEAELSENAAELMQQAVLKQGLSAKAKPILHSDNGSMMKSFTLKAKLETLGMSQSFSRPRVSNDNAYIESFFRTLKYVPTWPKQGFDSLEQARQWVQGFMHWYNEQHLHSRLKFVTPGQRHRGEDKALLQKRKRVYEQAKAQNPRRWSREVRNWDQIGAVTLNPCSADEMKREKLG